MSLTAHSLKTKLSPHTYIKRPKSLLPLSLRAYRYSYRIPAVKGHAFYSLYWIINHAATKKLIDETQINMRLTGKVNLTHFDLKITNENPFNNFFCEFAL